MIDFALAVSSSNTCFCPDLMQTWQSADSLADGVQQGHVVKVKEADQFHLLAFSVTHSCLDLRGYCNMARCARAK